jgi:hypothetical protein
MAKKGSGDVVDAVDRRHPSESAILDDSTLDPSQYYRFVQNRSTQMTRARLKGFRVVKPSEESVRTVLGQEDADAEDVIKHGDRILMARPKDVQEAARREKISRAEARLRSNDQRVRDRAKEHGVRLHEGDEDE